VLNATSHGEIGVLVVDDHEIVRRGILSTLSEIPGFRLLGEASTGEHAVQLARSMRPDVVLMDLRMPGIGGLEAARRICAALPDTRVIAVTAWDGEPQARLRRHGIAACVGKDVKRPELERIMRDVLAARAKPQCGECCASSNPFDQLTGREMQVCMLWLAGKRVGEIAHALFITPKTVHTHRYNILQKLGTGGDVELTKLAARHGLIGAASA
jgi:two-component system, NarL family, invasion response regulator UvrY